MDGVLLNPMFYHVEIWHKATKAHGFHSGKEGVYLHEGYTGVGTINIIRQRQLGRDAVPEEIESIHHEKSIKLNKYPQAEHMSGAWGLLQKIKSEGIIPTTVAGSGQASLLDRLEHNFPGMLRQELVVIAFDAKYGELNPESYSTVLEKGGLKPYETIVAENAPLGVETGHKAGIFATAVNTGPLDRQTLLNPGADLLFLSTQVLCKSWEALTRFLRRSPLKATIANN